MTNVLLIGVVAGLCAALLFAWAATGAAPVRVTMALLTSLPVATAGLGLGFAAALTAAAAGAIALALTVSPNLALAFAVSQALPMVVLTYLGGLSRTDGSGGVEWYPPGRLVAWAAGLATLLAFALLLMLGPDMTAIKGAVRSFVETFAAKQFPELSGGKTLSVPEIDDLSEIALVLLPAAMAISVMGTLLLNLWLGARIARAGGLLQRPWPDLAAMTFPRGLPLSFAIATAGTFLSGLPGLAASAMFGALFLAYVLMGLAIIHHVTRGHPWRSFALWGIYGGLVVFNSLASLMIAILGLADQIRPLRTAPPPKPDADRGEPPAPAA
jgi:hypothetical protein